MGKRINISAAAKSEKAARPTKKRSAKENADAALEAMVAEDASKLLDGQNAHLIANTDAPAEPLF